MSDPRTMAEGDAPPRLRIDVTMDAVVAAYIHEISGRHRPVDQAEKRVSAPEQPAR